MNCPKCNTALQPNAPFCSSCGLSLAAPAQGFPPPPPHGPAPGGYPPPPQGYAQGGFPPPQQGYPPYGFPPPMHGMPPMSPRSSGMAIAGFVLSFFCGLLGLIFSILGYNECKRSNGMVTGEGLALAGIIISIVSMLIGVVVLGSNGGRNF